MAFNFLGTMTLNQLMELQNFLTGELSNLEEEVNTLRIQMKNMQSVLENLIAADQKLGGNAINSISTTKLSVIDNSTIQDDTVAALYIDKVKKPFISTIKFKRERLEYKILKVHDTVEQLNEAIDRKAIAKTQTTELLTKVHALFNDKNKASLTRVTPTQAI